MEGTLQDPLKAQRLSPMEKAVEQLCRASQLILSLPTFQISGGTLSHSLSAALQASPSLYP